MRKRENGSLAKFATSPTDVLKWARNCPNESIRLIGLLIYFCSLRIEEVLRLKCAEVVYGQGVSLGWGSNTMRNVGLHNEMIVRIRFNYRTLNTIYFFDAEGAKLVEEALCRKRIQAILGHFNRKILATSWSKHGLPLSLNDLRRASIHWLMKSSGLHYEHIAQRSRLSVDSLAYIFRLFETEVDDPGPTGLGLSDNIWDLD